MYKVIALPQSQFKQFVIELIICLQTKFKVTFGFNRNFCDVFRLKKSLFILHFIVFTLHLSKIIQKYYIIIIIITT